MISGPTPRDLSLLCKLMAARAVSARPVRDPLEHLRFVESGVPFEAAGVTRFLDGIPPDAADVTAADVTRALALMGDAALIPPGDLYMKTQPRGVRRVSGEYYTPGWLVAHVLDRAGFDGMGDATLLDPMCGAGAFVTRAIERLRASQPGLRASDIARRVAGIDVNHLAVLMARTACLLALRPLLGEETVAMPVALGDAILDEHRGAAFDIVTGNPPWVGFESLPEEYRARTKGLWKHHGLFADGGGRGNMQVMLGRGKKDLSMLATCVAAEKYLKPGGRLVFVITQTVFKSVGSGAGFRRFMTGDGTPLSVLGVDDFSARRVFPTASTRTAVISLKKGEPTRYPVAFTVWGREGSLTEKAWAEPVDAGDPTSAWLTGTREEIARHRLLLGPSPYRARAGAYTGGANGVFWLRRADDTGLMTNIVESGKRLVPRVTTHLEPDLIFPLLRASEVGRFRAEPVDSILIPQDPVRRRGLDETLMAGRYPLTLAYLNRFRMELAARRDRGTRSLIDAGAPFYSIFSVSEETLAPWKVVWPRIASHLTAAVVGPRDGRPVVPQETCTFIACAGEQEARFLAGLLNSSLVNAAARAFGQTGGKSFGSPHLLRQIAVPRFDPMLTAHVRLAALVGETGESLSQDELDAAVPRFSNEARAVY